MDVPEWLKPILQQFPIATLALGMAALAVWWVNKRHLEELKRAVGTLSDVTKRTDAEIERVRADHKAADERHQAEVTRLTGLYERHIAALQERIRELETKTGSRRGS